MLEALALPQQVSANADHNSSRALKDKYVPERTPQLMAMTAPLPTGRSQPFPVECFAETQPRAWLSAPWESQAPLQTRTSTAHWCVVGAQACGFATEPATSALGDL